MDPLDEVCCLPNLSTIIKKPTIDKEAGDLLGNSHYAGMENHSIENNGIFKFVGEEKFYRLKNIPVLIIKGDSEKT